jgi:L-aspartate oxidase
METNHHFDIIVVGSGAAGLSLINYINEESEFKKHDITIALFSKKEFSATNTNWAQGGIAAVYSAIDSKEYHVQDTLIAGSNMNNQTIVSKVVDEAPNIIEDLVNWGMIFDRDLNDDFKLTLEGGHSNARILHNKDQTGKSIQVSLENKMNNNSKLSKYEHCQLIDVVKDSNGIFNLIFLDEQNSLSYFSASILVIATGGVGALYSKSTNQNTSTGDGIYFAKKLGAKIQDLAYIQFHPTGLYSQHETSYLVTEALRGQGAVLKNLNNISFMEKYDARGSLAPRDIVSRAIFNEMKINQSAHVYLDGTSLKHELWIEHFPNLFNECIKIDIDPRNEFIPVIPVQHYSCGGIYTDEVGETTVSGLYALGEVSCTGLHGANRLASNSLLEAIAFAKFAAKKIISQFEKKEPALKAIIPNNIRLKSLNKLTLQKIMTAAAGIERNDSSMKKSIEELKELVEKATSCEKIKKEDVEKNIMYDVGIDILTDALNKKENKGVHYNTSLLN